MKAAIKDSFISGMLPALLWWLLSLWLFTLPGKNLPKSGWLDNVYADKWVHAGIFWLMVTLWYRAVDLNRLRSGIPPVMMVAVPVACGLYGIAIEFIQENLIANRSFELADIFADLTGCLIAWYRPGQKLKTAN